VTAIKTVIAHGFLRIDHVDLLWAEHVQLETCYLVGINRRMGRCQLMATKTFCFSFTKVKPIIGYHIHSLKAMEINAMILVSLNG
jgi:hypothetical protein